MLIRHIFFIIRFYELSHINNLIIIFHINIRLISIKEIEVLGSHKKWDKSYKKTKKKAFIKRENENKL